MPPRAAHLEALVAEARRHLAAGEPAPAAAALRTVLDEAPGDAGAWNELGRCLNNQRDLDGAEAAFRRAIGVEDGFAGAWDHLGHVLRAKGRLDEALEAFETAARLDPTAARPHRNAAIVAAALGRQDAAVGHMGRAVAADPGDPLLYVGLGEARRRAGDPTGARDAYIQALALDSELVDAWAALGAVRQATGDYPGAAMAYREALGRDGVHPVARAGLAAICELEGKPEEGLALIEDRLGRDAPLGLAVTGARLMHRLGRSGEAMELLRQRAPDPRDPDLPRMHFTLGELLDAAGDYRAAFRHFHRGNELRGRHFDAQGFRSTIARLRELSSAEWLRSLPRSTVTSQRPVFIVGAPRSGTSLVEQMLSCHPDVVARGERLELFRFVRELCGEAGTERWPEPLAWTTAERLSALATRYLDDPPSAGAMRTTDKMPANWLHLGLVDRMLPGARVVWCRRDAMDCGLSCFQQDFRGEGLDFTTDLGHIGLYIAASERLMRHWQAATSLAVLEFDYERLVAEPEAALRELLGFLGLPWHAGCLAHHESGRTVYTASFAQVRRPLAGDRVGRWRHYDFGLEPLRQSLAEPGTAP